MKMSDGIKWSGFTLIDLMMIIAALGVMASMILPRFAKARVHCCRASCTNRLRQIGLAHRQWAIDNGDKYPAAVSTADGGAKEWVERGDAYASYLVMSNELNTPKILICPDDATPNRVIATTFSQSVPSGSIYPAIPLTNNSSVSYFVGLDADETKPTIIVSGDDNFTVAATKPKQGVLMLWTNSPVAWTKERHVNQGNIGLADGSVMAINTLRFQETLVKTDLATNRLAMP
jgi:prepilin-type processing-associated H-X9-DG protein